MSRCELCDKDMQDGEARYWLICHTCRRGLGAKWSKLRPYSLDDGEFWAWKRLTMIHWHQHLNRVNPHKDGRTRLTFGRTEEQDNVEKRDE
jgi:hypothetical protein